MNPTARTKTIIEESSWRLPGDDADRRECINSFSVLVVHSPFDERDALRLCFRWGETDNLALKMQDIAGANGHHPTQPIDAQSDERMRTERTHLYREVHCHRGRVPAGGCETFERGMFGSDLVEV